MDLDPNAPPYEHDRHHEEAADWLQRLDDPNLKEEEIQAWLVWFSACNHHRKAFEELQTLRRRFRAMPAEYGRQMRIETRLSGFAKFRPWKIAAGLAALMLVAGVWWTAQNRAMEGIYAAPTTQHRTVTLTDGSTLSLGAFAMVTMRYTQEERVLHIERGQAYFEVRHDAKRPFVVAAQDVVIKAVGTAFNVTRETDKVTVTVTEGVVEITRPNAQFTRVSEGGRAVFALGGVPVKLANHGKAPQPAWENGRVEFVNAPLSEVLRVINVHTAVPLSIDDPRIADLTYSGTILLAHLDEWIASLPHLYPVRRVALEGGGATLVTRSNR